MACIQHTPCQHDSHDHNVMIYVEVSRFSANLLAIRSRGRPLDSGKGPVRFVPLSGPKLARPGSPSAMAPTVQISEQQSDIRASFARACARRHCIRDLQLRRALPSLVGLSL